MAARTLQQTHNDLLHHQAATLARIAQETNNTLPQRQAQAALPGDPWQLRGIPAVGVKGGIGGAIPGTRPETAIR